MILAFQLDKPGCDFWDGKWSGVGKKCLLTRAFRSNVGIEQAKEILAKGYYHYRFPDGSSVGVIVCEVSIAQAGNLRKSSHGFCGYDWMVDTICKYGEPLDSETVKKLEEREAEPPVATLEIMM